MIRFIPVVAALVGALVLAASATADADFSDPAGDAGGAPDVTSVVVANDAFGTVRFSISVPSEPKLALDSHIVIGIDTDRLPTTGDDDGTDYLFGLDGTEGWYLIHWDGTQWADSPSSTGDISFVNGMMVAWISTSELGGVQAFDFYIVSAKIGADGAFAAREDGPDTGWWTYNVVPKTYSLRAGGAVILPKAPVSGKLATVRTVINRGDIAEFPAAAQISCRVLIGGTKVKATPVYRNGVASCAFKVPLKSKGKKIAGTIVAADRGVSTLRTFAFRVAR